jgi:GNAT superfamily N-acetyltransferase
MASIKKISKSDLPMLAELYKELSGNTGNPEKMTAQFGLMQSNEDYILPGANIDGRLVGSLMGIICHDMAGDCRPFMVIENVIVAGACRKQGIGGMMMNEIEKIAREKNCYYTMLVSGFQRKEAHLFYVSLGYRLDRVQGFKKFL